MKKKPMILGNWKMYKTNKEAQSYVKTLLPLVEKLDVLIGLAVPFTAISLCAELVADSSVMIGAQNMHSADEGAFTGEIAGKMLQEAGAEFVVLGHSERRVSFHETNEEIGKKVSRALEEGLKVVLCVGESLEQRKKGCEEHLEEQLFSALSGVKKTLLKQIAIAYEPIWAIGTGKSAKPKDVEKTHMFLRAVLEQIHGKTYGKKLPILYGGSVKKANIESFLQESHIDGALVGGASLEATEFASMIALVS